MLFANRIDHLPVIGKIKADAYRNPFLGLVQALTYAVELSTLPQRARLEKPYPSRFVWPDGGPFVDMNLMLIRYPDDQLHREFLSLVDQLSQGLMTPGTFTTGMVRRIVCLHTCLDSSESAAFTAKFAYPG